MISLLHGDARALTGEKLGQPFEGTDEIADLHTVAVHALDAALKQLLARLLALEERCAAIEAAMAALEARR